MSDDQYIKEHGGEGILEDSDVPELKSGADRIKHLMKDGEWHDAHEIRLAAGVGGQPASEGLRRLRDLRKEPHINIEKERIPGSRNFQYRMVLCS